MEISDWALVHNKDWDPAYLVEIFNQNFFEFSDLSQSAITDEDFVCEMDKMEKYNPLVEDISLDDSALCEAIEQIEAS